MNNITDSIERFYNQVPEIPESKDYWLIRTLSGELYDLFVAKGYIAIGFNEISLEAIYDINSAHSEKGEKFRHVKNLVIDTFPDEKRPGLIANQILQFTYDIKAGDIIVIPSKDSTFIHFGVVEETPLMPIDYDGSDDECSFYRRKKVNWLKQVRRDQLEPMLFKMFFRHNTVNNISDYGNLIESTLHNYFVKDGEEHVVFNIRRNENIGAIDLFQLGFYLLKLTEDYFNENGLEFDINDFDVKVNLNSKGKLKFITKFKEGGVFIALMTIFINGGGGTIPLIHGEIDLSTDGLIKNIIEYQNNRAQREMKRDVLESLRTLEVENPDDALEAYRQFLIEGDTGE